MSVAIAAAFPGVLVASPFDGALSPEAQALRREFDQAFATSGRVSETRDQKSVARLLQSLEDAAAEGIYATPESLCHALAVLQSLPEYVPLPEVVVEADSELGLDWEFGRRHVLSISVGDGPMLRFAALVNSEPVHGRVPFAGVLPATISFFLNRLLAAR